MKRFLKEEIVAVLILISIPVVALAAFDRNLTSGMSGADVKQLQQFLKDQKLYSGPVTGKLFVLTQGALKRFQEREGLPVTGKADETTRRKMNEILVNQTSTKTDTSTTKLALGDKKYSTSPKVGYVYSCQTTFNGRGANSNPPWISGDYWYPDQKSQVSGNVSWSGKFSVTASDANRVLTGNGLPSSHTTGIYPIQSTDAAYKYDQNPNKISEFNFTYNLPLNPTYKNTPTCVSGEVGVAVTGIPIFSGFDAEGRDAVAHEVQDKCDGHPQEAGEYHYHNASRCIVDTRTSATSHSTLIGYAYDGFGIYGKYGENGKLLSNSDLDVCHGHTHEITWEGKTAKMYHYHATAEFPYTVSCFRGTPVQPNRPQSSNQQQGLPPKR